MDEIETEQNERKKKKGGEEKVKFFRAGYS